jgi:hypothetical protein
MRIDEVATSTSQHPGQRRVRDLDVGVGQAGSERGHLLMVGQIADYGLGTVQLRCQRLEPILPSIGEDEASAARMKGTGNRVTTWSESEFR